MSMQDIVEKVAEVQAGIEGVNYAFGAHEIPDTLTAEPPCFVSFLEEGAEDELPGWTRHTFTILMQLFLAKPDTPSPASQAVEFVDSVRTAFKQSVTLGGVVTKARIIKWNFGELAFGGTSYLGLSFTLQIEVDESCEFSP